jgi:hypothetical protein
MVAGGYANVDIVIARRGSSRVVGGAARPGMILGSCGCCLTTGHGLVAFSLQETMGFRGGISVIVKSHNLCIGHKYTTATGR